MNKKYYLLILIFLLGFLIRIWNISEIPPGLNRDEASIGYTAYSLLKTGKDEYGKSWPISFKSFGDWKLPLYIYVTIPFIGLFGLTDVVVRLPSVLFGSLSIYLAYFLSREFFMGQGKNESASWMKKIPILSAFLFALSPWSIHLSRNASEANIAVFFASFGLLLFMRSDKNIWNIIFGTIILSLSLYTYHANHIFTVLLFFGMIILLWKRYKASPYYWISIAIFLLLSFFIFNQTLFSADKIKISGLLASGDPALVYEKVTLDRLQHQMSPSLIVSLLHNKVVFSTISTLQNYMKSFSPEFLFISGGGNAQHNIPDFGNLYLWEAPFLLFGLSFLLVNKFSNRNLILWWLLIAPVASSITKDAPHTARMASILPLFDIIIALGILKGIWDIVNKRKVVSTLIYLSLIFIFILNFIVWTDRYFIHFPMRRAFLWGEGYRRLISFLNENRNFGAHEIVMSRPEYSPYIYFLFYNIVDPFDFQKSVVRYPETAEGFQHVAKFDKYNFRQIDWTDDLSIPERLYIDWSDQIPKNATSSAILINRSVLLTLSANKKDTFGLKVGDIVVSKKLGDIKLQNGDSMFTLIKTSKISTGEN